MDPKSVTREPRRTVLIVNAEASASRRLARIVARAGAETIEASAVAQAEEVLASRSVDAVLCDLHLNPPERGDAFLLDVAWKWPRVRRVLCAAGSSPVACAHYYLRWPCATELLLRALGVARALGPGAPRGR